jgi:hypothetical protein
MMVSADAGGVMRVVGSYRGNVSHSSGRLTSPRQLFETTAHIGETPRPEWLVIGNEAVFNRITMSNMA